MFLLNPPTVRPLEIFTSMPDKYRRTGERSLWADVNQGGRLADSFLEGPVFDAQGNLYVTDIPFGRVFRIDPRGEWDLVAQWDGEPNGMKFLNADQLLITDYRNGLVVLDIASGQVRPYLERRNSERFKGVNDLVFDSRGNLYFTDQGQTGLHDPTGRLYRLRPSGQLALLLANVPSPNGVALSPEYIFAGMFGMPDPRANLKECELCDTIDFRPGAVCSAPAKPGTASPAADAEVEALVKKIAEQILQQIKG